MKGLLKIDCDRYLRLVQGLISCMYLVGAAGFLHAGEIGPTEGLISYYSDSLQGRPTASGEAYDPRALTAAHTTLDFGTRVRVTNLENGKSAVVVVNDRGPFVKGRILDVSRQAAEQLEMTQSGVTQASIALE